MLEAIQRKVDGQEITAEPTEAPQTKIIDLMDALKASLAKPRREHGAEEARQAGRPEGRQGSRRQGHGQTEEEGRPLGMIPPPR